MAKKKNYRVYISQVNQTYLDVAAHTRAEAEDRACARWRETYAQPDVMSVELLPPKNEKL